MDRVRKIHYVLVALVIVGVIAGLAIRVSVVHRDEGVVRPNVVFILLDALRADRIGAERNGVPVTPFLTRLASEGVYYPNAVSPATWTKPAMTSIFTGLDVDTHRVYFSTDASKPGQSAQLTPEALEQLRALGYVGANETPSGQSDPLPPSLLTLAEFLQRARYETAAIQTNGNLTKELGFDRGFDTYEFNGDAPGNEVTDHAIAAFDKLRAPFLLYAHYMDVHAPYAAPEDYRALFPAVDGLTVSDRANLDHFVDYLIDHTNYVLGLESKPKYPPLTDAGVAEMKTRYDAAARFMDTQVERLVTTIRERAPNTLFIVVADHGEELMDHGGLGHGVTMYEEVLGVPLLFVGPGIAPRKSTVRGTSLDILPTVADYLHLSRAPQWQAAVNLFEAPESEPHFSRTRGPWKSLNVDLEAVVDGTYKLILGHEGKEVTLFDLSADPKEQANLAPAQPDRVQAMRDQISDHQASDAKRATELGLNN